MSSYYRICCKDCKVSLNLDKAGWLIFDGVKDASNKNNKEIFSKKFREELKMRGEKKLFRDYEIYHLLRGILFILEHSGHEIVMWQDEGFRLLKILEWKGHKLDFERLPEEIMNYKEIY